MRTVEHDQARNKMWSKIYVETIADGFSNWDDLNKNQKKKFKQQYSKQIGVLPRMITTSGTACTNYTTPSTSFPNGTWKYAGGGAYEYHSNSLDCCKTTSIPPPMPLSTEEWYNKKEQENAMQYVNMNATVGQPDADKINYLKDRLHQVISEKKNEAREKFFIDWRDNPKTPAESVQRIKNGQFTFNKNFVNEDGTWRKGYDYAAGRLDDMVIDWRTTPPDDEGYKIWKETFLTPKQQKVEDTIRVLSPEDGLKALQEFESNTIN